MKIDKKLLGQKMINMGFREGLSGTAMLRKAVELWEPGIQMTKALYPAVAKAFRTTPAAVERAMRAAIADIYDGGCSWYAAECFGFDQDPPTVSDFVSRMAWICGMEEGCA